MPPKKFADMAQDERIEACYQHAVLKFFSNSVMTNTSLRERLQIPEKQRAQVSRLIREALNSGRIKLKIRIQAPLNLPSIFHIGASGFT